MGCGVNGISGSAGNDRVAEIGPGKLGADWDVIAVTGVSGFGVPIVAACWIDIGGVVTGAANGCC